MGRAPAINQSVILPPPGEKYDAGNERETRRVLEEALRRLSQWGTVTDVPAPVAALSVVTGATDTVPYFTSVSAMALASLTPYARTVLACATAAAARTALGLGSLAVLSTVTETELTLADVTTANVSSAAHGLTPKLPADASKFLNGSGLWAVPTVGTALGTFPAISNLALRLSAELSTMTVNTDGRVAQINDMSAGWGSNFTATGTARPRLKNGIIGGRPGLIFDGVTAKLTAGATKTLAQPCTVVAVLMNWKGGANNNNVLRDSGGGPVLFQSSANSWAIFAGTSLSDTGLFTQNTSMLLDGIIAAPAVAIGVFNGASSAIYNNGVASATANAGAGGFSGTLSVGGDSTTSFAHMVLYELLIFSKALNSTEIGQLNTYYANALGLYL